MAHRVGDRGWRDSRKRAIPLLLNVNQRFSTMKLGDLWVLSCTLFETRLAHERLGRHSYGDARQGQELAPRRLPSRERDGAALELCSLPRELGTAEMD